MMSGEGGIITTNDPESAEMYYSLREHGRIRDKPWYYHARLGWNYRMTELQAAILRVQQLNYNYRYLINFYSELTDLTCRRNI
ncbi:MAG: hypothetical protein DRZ82_01910 [Thermoprotei archaeon]|nr:MAG: hypothetical protein DRZ82_01910 [Thermoprotei archaeon]